jgi:hypothetical protein
MQDLYYSSKKICTVTENEYSQFKLLCPYWGLSLIDRANVILGALSTFMIGVHGLSQKKFKELTQLLQHTGVSMTENPQTPALQHMYIAIEPGHHIPLSITTDSGDIFYLNPLQEYNDTPVQAAVHKQIYLKPKKGDLHITVSSDFEENICEYISYLIIQRCIKDQFQSLTSVSQDIFHSLNQNALVMINPYFSEIQKLSFPETKSHPLNMTDMETESEKKKQNNTPAVTAEEEWEVCDPSISASNRLQGGQPINPFKQKAGTGSPISPFHPGTAHKNSTVIRPFS